MKVLFLTIALSLFAVLHAEESNSSGKLGGVYHLNAVVANKEVAEKDHETFPPIAISQLDNGNVEVKFTMKENGECKEIELTMEKTENSNEYTLKEDYQHIQKVRVTKTSVPNNWIFECKGHIHDEEVKMIKLLSLNKEADPQALEDFQKIAKERSYDESRIIFPKQEEACVPEHD
ncbi:late lactation protein B-like [Antechinus flavipes]|uniref:late lactation protein B-like n=1 Tax=Antechinus flavipes TaxID=38775 RepID=UPI002235B7F8|nr:late lactation protein B-like [Antechinus flavipes]